jgi:hypothetical protein
VLLALLISTYKPILLFYLNYHETLNNLISTSTTLEGDAICDKRARLSVGSCGSLGDHLYWIKSNHISETWVVSTSYTCTVVDTHHINETHCLTVIVRKAFDKRSRSSTILISLLVMRGALDHQYHTKSNHTSELQTHIFIQNLKTLNLWNV